MLIKTSLTRPPGSLSLLLWIGEIRAQTAGPRPSPDPQDLRTADVFRLQFDKRPIGVFQGVLLDFGPERNLGGEFEELADVGPGDIRDALDLLLVPEVRRIIE